MKISRLENLKNKSIKPHYSLTGSFVEKVYMFSQKECPELQKSNKIPFSGFP